MLRRHRSANLQNEVADHKVNLMALMELPKVLCTLVS
jgi:hypothetical protein